jgi:dihydropteroate synthase
MFKFPVRDQIWEISKPQLMGILNATKDSFYEESRVQATDLAIEKARQYILEGASIIDIGGQSTRPNAHLNTIEEEMANVLPIVEAIHAQFPNILISVDTFHSSVAKQALNAGAHIINDISCGSFDSAMYKIVANYQAGYIGMHFTGTKDNMHHIPEYRSNILEELITFFKEKKQLLLNVGIENWVIDPGFGFGKSVQDNFNIIKGLRQLQSIELPILLGVSRKSSIYKTLNIDPEDALNGTTIVNTFGILNGASILRVHDVKEAKQILDLHPFLA